jgi:hypothetical protein
MKILAILITLAIVLVLAIRLLIARLDRIEQQFLEDEARENE